jgi:hypothetical protein
MVLRFSRRGIIIGAKIMGHDKAEKNNPQPTTSREQNMGMDVNGNMRFGDEFTISLAGDNVQIMQAGTARTKTIPATEFNSVLREKWFGEY